MNQTTRHILFGGVLLALPISAYFVVFKPRNAEIAKAKKEIALKEDMLAKLRQATSQTDDLVKANEQIRQSIEAIQAQLPSAKEMDDVLRQVANITSKHDLKVPQFKRNDKSLPAGLAMEQPIEIEITGDFDGFYQFLLELEQMPRITRVPDLSIVRSDKIDGEMKAKMTLSIYYEGGTAPAPATAAVPTTSK
jgi:type IV pilus assembly protein PilO